MIKHKPVLLDEVLNFIKPGYKVVLDGTLGHGGHAQSILQHFPHIEKYIAIDRDPIMLFKATKFLDSFADRLVLVNTSYDDLEYIAQASGVEKFDVMFLDLGVNMEHFKDGQRGFSIKQEGPLDMRFDTNQDFDAKQLLQTYSKQDLIDILQKYGDFSQLQAEKIVKSIVDVRNRQKFKTTFQLKDFLKKIGLGERKIAVFFQVLRIEVNQELTKLEIFLDKFVNWLNTGGRCMIISYHSIENRLVKNKFKQLAAEGKVKILTKHTIKPSWQEIKSNKAARSAQLRVVERR